MVLSVFLIVYVSCLGFWLAFSFVSFVCTFDRLLMVCRKRFLKARLVGYPALPRAR